MDDEFRRFIDEFRRLMDNTARASDPKEAKSLPELLGVLMAEIPSLGDRIDDMLRLYPNLVTFHMDAQGKQVAEYRLSSVVLIYVLNFLSRAYGRPEVPPHEPPGRQH